MSSSRVIHHLLRHPSKLMRYELTGRLPPTFSPTSPLIALLDALSPRDRAAIRGVTLSPALGYVGGFNFASAEQLLRYLRPAMEMVEGECWPAESRRIKAFTGPLRLQTLLEASAAYPEALAQKYPRL